MGPRNEDRDAIRQLAEDWRAGWLAGDVDALMALYADDAVLMPQDQPAVLGKDAIRALYEPTFAEFSFRSESTVREVEASGDWGFLWASYALTAMPKSGGEPFRCVGKSVYVVRKGAAGDWKIARLIDNSDGPATETR